MTIASKLARLLTFEEGRMGVDQLLAIRPSEVGGSGMPAIPEWAAR